MRRSTLDATSPGVKFGRLTVVSLSRDSTRRLIATCRCDCGADATAIAADLNSGKRVSCGCARTKHGHSRGAADSPEMTSWRSMVTRCTNRSHKNWGHYGGRGIAVCDRWLGPDGFANFLADMGDRPDGTTLDRRNNDGNYEPGNCRWATKSEQGRNRRTSKLDAATVREIVIGRYRAMSNRATAEAVGVSKGAVDAIRAGYKWRDVVEAARKEAV